MIQVGCARAPRRIRARLPITGCDAPHWATVLRPAASLGNNAISETLGYEKIARQIAALLGFVLVPTRAGSPLGGGGRDSTALRQKVRLCQDMESGPRP